MSEEQDKTGYQTSDYASRAVAKLYAFKQAKLEAFSKFINSDILANAHWAACLSP